VIDFIDMTAPRNQRAVEDCMREALDADRARVQIGRISRFGLLEMSRQRLRPSLRETSGIVCPRCNGQGVIRDVESLSLAIMRLIEEEALKDRTAEVRARVPLPVAAFLLNEKRNALTKIELRCRTRILILPTEQLETPHFEVQRLRDDSPEVSNAQLSYEISGSEEVEADGSVSATRTLVRQEAAIKSVPRPPASTPPARQPGSPPATVSKPASGGLIKGLVRSLVSLFASEEPSKSNTQIPSSANGERSRNAERRSARPQNGARRREETRDTREAREPRKPRPPREQQEEPPVRELRPALDAAESEVTPVVVRETKSREERPARPPRQPRPPRNLPEPKPAPVAVSDDEPLEVNETSAVADNREASERPQRRTRGQRRRSNRSERQQSVPGWQSPAAQAEAQTSIEAPEQEHEPVIVRIINPHDDTPAPAVLIEPVEGQTDKAPAADAMDENSQVAQQPVKTQALHAETAIERPAPADVIEPPTDRAEALPAVSPATQWLPASVEAEMPSQVEPVVTAVQETAPEPIRPAPQNTDGQAPKRAPNDPREVRRRMEAERKKQAAHAPAAPSLSQEQGNRPPLQTPEKASLARAITEAVLHIDSDRPPLHNISEPAPVRAEAAEIPVSVIEGEAVKS